MTPVVETRGGWVKRDDLYQTAGVNGGKARACLALAQGAAGLVLGAGRNSSQAQIAAHVAQAQGIPCRWHTATGPETAEMRDAAACGCEILRHRPGYSSVLAARAAADAAARRWRLLPYGLCHRTAVDATRGEAQNIPREASRVVIAVGSGTNVSGVLWGLRDLGLSTPVLGVRVGGDPTKQLDLLAPHDWLGTLELVPSTYKYSDAIQRRLCGIDLDPYYEAKAAEYLRPGDLFWIIGCRVG